MIKNKTRSCSGLVFSCDDDHGNSTASEKCINYLEVHCCCVCALKFRIGICALPDKRSGIIIHHLFGEINGIPSAQTIPHCTLAPPKKVCRLCYIR